MSTFIKKQYERSKRARQSGRFALNCVSVREPRALNPIELKINKYRSGEGEGLLNKLWFGMIMLGIAVAAVTGRMGAVTAAAIDSSKEAVGVCITMLGIISMWTGLMKIAEKGGMIEGLARGMRPLLRFLFPDVPADGPAMQYIATNMIANILGLGWAATPAGLMAMEELQKLNRIKERASNAMCMFMITNMSSLQLITMSVIAFRAQYGSHSPTEIVGPGLAATFITTIAGIVVAKALERVYG